MTAFAGVIHINQARVLQQCKRWREFNGKLSQQNPCLQTRAKESIGSRTGGSARYVGFVHRFQSAGNMRYDNGAETLDAREEAMRWLRPVTS
jgi:hypothetical protein